jgi:hypothetical protein
MAFWTDRTIGQMGTIIKTLASDKESSTKVRCARDGVFNNFFTQSAVILIKPFVAKALDWPQ